MKVLFVNTNLSWGGGEHWHLLHMQALAKRGIAVAAVVHPAGELQQRLRSEVGLADIHTAHFRNLSWLSPAARFRARSLLRETQPDALLVSLPSDAKVILPCARALGIGCRVYRRGIAVPVKNSLINRRLFRSGATDIIVNSLDTKASVLARNPKLVDPKNIHLIYNGLPEDPRPVVSAPANRKAPASPKLELGAGLRIFHAGRLTPQKGQLFLLDVLGLLRDQGFAFQCVLAGSGELEMALRNKIQQLGLEPHVHLIGFQKDLVPWYDWSDVFVMPSQFEGFGFAAAEAMLRSRPVVASDASSLREIVIHNETGQLVAFGNTAGFADALRAFSDPAATERMGTAGRNRALQHFALESAVDHLLGVFQNRLRP